MVSPVALRIGHFPGHAPDVTVVTLRKAEATDVDSAGLSEAYKVAASLDSPLYAGVVADSVVETRAVHSPNGDGGDNPVLVRRDHKVVRRRAFKVDRPGLPAKFAPERWLMVVDYLWADAKVCHINAHPSPVFVGEAKWRKVMRRTAREVRKARRRGCLVIVTGDLQTVSPAKDILHAAGLNVWVEHVDFIASDKRLKSVQREQLDGGMDHPWLVETFVQQP